MAVRDHRHHRGFTLIEVMVTTAIVGILASVAIPILTDFQNRAKSAERRYLMQAIFRSVDDLFVRDGRFPTDLGNGNSLLNLTVEQPNGTVSATRTGWRTVIVDPSDQWGNLALSVEGGVYYRYGGLATIQGPTRLYWIWARGDLDGDGIENRWDKYYQWSGSIKQLFPSASTLECSDCSWATETGAGTW
jgi:prepilin-type N-terminal cleavage/methylation domain-containing protein